MKYLKSASLLALAVVAGLVSHPGWAQLPDRITLQSVESTGVDRATWVTVANHVHTDHSHDARAPLTELIAQAKRLGLEAMVLTDHNSTSAVAPELLEPLTQELGVTLIPGEEWSSRRWGHAGLVGFGGKAVLEKDGLEGAMRAAHEAGAVALANHPSHWGLAWPNGWQDQRLGGVEVWNGWWSNPLAQNESALVWWNDALRSGRRLVAMGGADYHGYFYAKIDQAVNRVQVAESGQAGIMDGIRQGRVQIAASPRSPWLDLTVDGKGIGESVSSPGPHRIRVSVQGGQGYELRLVTRQGVVARKRITSAQVTFEGEYPAGASTDYVRAELREAGAPLGAAQVLANPVYLGAWDPVPVAQRP